MPPTIIRRPATEADYAYLYDLRIASMAPHIVAAGLNVTPEEHQERVRDRLASAEILHVGDSPAGMIKVDRQAGYWHIMQLQVEPAMHGRGVGGEILRQIIAEARAAGAQLTLGVLKVNPAQRLYRRMGFVIYGEGQHEFEMVWRGTDAEMLTELRGLEIALQHACVKPDPARVAELVHDDFREIGRSGKLWDKQSLLEALAAEAGSPSPPMHSQNFVLHARTAENATLIYRSANIEPDGSFSRHTLRSSLWTRQGERWQMLFHQGTACDVFERELMR
ncbi:MAG: GNAT family N-acetyltransferase [Betaproteobacteria bacterium]|nr:GNAT family N-acetyltransferase [Betaproteobacteria bacterium]